MTRQEAIDLLGRLLIHCDPTDCPHSDCDRCIEAINMAGDALEQEPKQRHWAGTPEEFAKKMYQLAGSGDEEADHVKADELMCQLLTSLGYGEGVKIFRDMDKWYS